MKLYFLITCLFSIINFLYASELENTYFATRTMLVNKLQPCNLYGASLGNYPYSYSKEHINMKGVYQDNTGEQWIILNVTIDSIKMVLQTNEQNKNMIKLIDATQSVRELFSSKRKDDDVFKLLISGLNVNTYRNYFKGTVEEIKHEYYVKIGLGICMMVAIFFGTRYTKSVYNPRIVNILAWISEFLGTCFIIYQFYQFARLCKTCAVLIGGTNIPLISNKISILDMFFIKTR